MEGSWFASSNQTFMIIHRIDRRGNETMGLARRSAPRFVFIEPRNGMQNYTSELIPRSRARTALNRDVCFFEIHLFFIRYHFPFDISIFLEKNISILKIWKGKDIIALSFIIHLD